MGGVEVELVLADDDIEEDDEDEDEVEEDDDENEGMTSFDSSQFLTRGTAPTTTLYFC